MTTSAAEAEPRPRIVVGVGRRGHGGLASALLGSVSLHCVLHAHCPVLVLRKQPGEG